MSSLSFNLLRQFEEEIGEGEEDTLSRKSEEGQNYEGFLMMKSGEKMRTSPLFCLIGSSFVNILQPLLCCWHLQLKSSKQYMGKV